MRNFTERRLALVASALSLAASPALGQALPTSPAKSPTTAAAIAFFIPGGGHLYAGEPIRGLTLLAATTGIAAWAVTSSHTYNVDYTCKIRNCTDKSQDPNYQTLGVGLSVAGAFWLYSLLDAPHAANRENARNKPRSVSSSAGIPLTESMSAAPMALSARGKASLGLRFSLAF